MLAPIMVVPESAVPPINQASEMQIKRFVLMIHLFIAVRGRILLFDKFAGGSL